MTRPRVIAHRGASAQWPENTVAAFHGARTLGADWVELDVRRCRDGALVVIHDAKVGRRAVVETLTSELDSSIPSLAEALDACGGMGVNVEIKNGADEPGYDDSPALASQVLAVMDAHVDPGRALVTCFDRPTLDLVHHHGPRWPTGLLTYRRRGVRDLDRLAAAGHRAINPMDQLVGRGLVSSAHDAGLEVNVWTVDDPRRIEELATLGVDGIITNVPDVAVAVLAGLTG